MSEITINRHPLEGSPFFVPSDDLRELRESIRELPDIERLMGNAVQFRLVADTSTVLADIRWLAQNRKGQNTRTSILETVDAGTLKVYAPRTLVAEVEEHLPNIALRDGLKLETLRNEWHMYRSKLTICEPSVDLIEKHSNGVDPADASFVALAEELKTDGILSKDQHIERMGGLRLTLDFILAVRDYSRAAAIELNIKFKGVLLGFLTIVMLRALMGMIKSILVGISRLPDWVKVILLISIVFIILHPASRRKISEYFKRVTVGVKGITPDIIEHLNKVAAISQQHGELARQHLDRANSEIGKRKHEAYERLKSDIGAGDLSR